MTKHYIGKIILSVMCAIFVYMGLGGVYMTPYTYAQNDPEFQLIPEADPSEYSEKVEELSKGETSGKFFLTYNKYAKDLNSKGDKDDECSGLGAQFASGIMNRDTILCLVSKIIRWIANMTLVAGGGMVIYAGYSYAIAVFSNNSTVDAGGKAIKRAVSGIVVLIFAYAIVKFLLEAFL